MATGEWIGTFALTEPEAGSNAANLKTTAVRKGDKYILNGSKHFITNGTIAHVFTVMAVPTRAKGRKGSPPLLWNGIFPVFASAKSRRKWSARFPFGGTVL